MKTIALVAALSALAWAAAAAQTAPQPAAQSPAAAQDGEHGSVKCLKAAESSPGLAPEDRAWAFCKDAQDAQPVACYAAATAMPDDFPVNLKDGYSKAAFKFCQGSGSVGRVRCYWAARDAGFEFDEKGARLFCGNASSTKPVLCYKGAMRQNIPHEKDPAGGAHSKAFEFCRDSGSAERVNCYEAAMANIYDADIAYQLCKGAGDLKPVQCYVQASQVKGSPQKALAFCTPPASGQ